eukprot:578361_1
MQQSINANTQYGDLDPNHDGKLTAEELAASCNISLQDAQDCIQQYDEDGNGTLDPEEFAALKEQILAQQREELTDQLSHDQFHDTIDADGDGKLSAAELAAACNLTAEEAQNIIFQYDQDGDGMLDAEEFEDLKEQILSQQRDQMTDKLGANDTLDTLDNNNDGQLTAKELSEACGISEVQARNIIQQYDVDGDGSLDPQEFETLKQQVLKQQREKAASNINNYSDMNAMDDNKDGLVSASELAQACNISQKEAELLIQQYDKNGGGFLNQQEFETLKQSILKEQREKERLKQIQKDRQLRQQQQQQQYGDQDNKPQEFKHKWKFGMNFDPKGESVVIYISDEVTSKNWGITLKKEDFNGPIRQEYRKLGQVVSTGTIKYDYPQNGGPLGVLIEGQNNAKYTYSCPQQY